MTLDVMARHPICMSLVKQSICALAVLVSSIAPAQQLAPRDASRARSMTINVAVEAAHGAAPDALTAADFKLLDNKAGKAITSVRRVTADQGPLSAILVVDAVNTNFTRVAYVRGQVEKFLKANGGRLEQPTTIAILTDKGAEISPGFSKDGNALNAALQHADIGLREIRRDSGIWGADERVQISLTALQQIIDYGGTLPGRKIVMWISPGWPLLSGARIELDSKQQKQIFGDVVSYSAKMQKANVTLYNINPLGPEENLLRADFYQSFLKGVSKPGQTDVADLSLQVLAEHSGGLVATSNSDVAGNLTRYTEDAKTWYELTFDTAVPEQPNEYHHIEVSVDKPGVTARTRDGYYAQP